MISLHLIRTPLCHGALALAALCAAAAPAQEAPADLPALRELIAKERSENGTRATGTAVVSITARENGPVEVRDRDGDVIERIPTDAFAPVGQVSTEGLKRFHDRRAEKEDALAARKKAAGEALEQQREAEKLQQEEAAKQQEAAEAKWQADFAADSDTYKARRRNQDNLKAVKIDARQISEDGTIQYEGKTLKPIRLWSTERKRYEMAIPVESP